VFKKAIHDESKTQLMLSLVEQWRQSGKSQLEFSSENGLRLYNFCYGVKMFRESQSAQQVFASLTVNGEATNHVTQTRIEIELGNGFVVRI